MQSTRSVVWSVVIFCSCVGIAKGDFIVDFWGLSATCSASGQDGGVFQFTVQNPFAYSHSVPVHNSMAQAAYQFAWDNLNGDFRTTGNVAGEGGSSICEVGNQIQIHTTSDVLLSAEGEWTYHFSGGLRTTTILMSVRDLVSGQQIFATGDTGQNGPPVNDPNDDTLHISGSVLLPAGGNYRLTSIMDIRAITGSATSISTGSGYATFGLTTVPEPNSAALFVFGMIACLMRKRIR